MSEQMPFDVDQFLEGLNRDSARNRTASDRLTKLLMNTRDNQGTAKILPFISKKYGNIYVKIEGVREYCAPTSVIETDGDIWYRVLPIEFYDDLSPEDLELYNEVIGLYDSIRDADVLEWDTLRRRNYVLFTGICLGLTNTEGNDNDEYNNQPVLFVYPSTTPLESMNKTIADKKLVYKDNFIPWLQKTITPAQTNRSGIILINFRKGDVGYNSQVTFEVNNEFNTVVDPAAEFSDDIVSKFDDPVETFVGWMYDNERKSYFNPQVFKELRDILKLKLKEINMGDLDGDSGSEDMPPVPGVESNEQTPAEEPAKKRPF